MSAGETLAARRPLPLDGQPVLCTGVLAVVAFGVVYPIVLVVLQLDSIAQRTLEGAVVVACIIMVISLAGALLARLVGPRSSSVG